METLLILIIICILWGNGKYSSISNSIKNNEEHVQKTNRILLEVKEILQNYSPEYIPDYKDNFKELKDELEAINNELKDELEAINNELKWWKSDSFASKTINVQDQIVNLLHSIEINTERTVNVCSDINYR